MDINLRILLGVLVVFLVFPVALSATSEMKTIFPINNTSDYSNVTLPKVMYTPNQPLYGLERFAEKINLWLTFDKEAKLKLSMHYAELRLAEAKLMIQNNKTKYVHNLLEEYNIQWNKSTEKVKEMYDDCMTAQRRICNNLNLTQKCNELNLSEEKCNNLTNVCDNVAEKKCEHFADMAERALNATDKHIAVLQNVLNKVPEQAKSAIQHAIEISQKGHDKVVEKVREINSIKNEVKEAENTFEEIFNNHFNQTINNGNHSSQTLNNTNHQSINQTEMQNMTQNGSNASLPPHEQPHDLIN